ncbi:hypothetical protein [Chromobacterium haemolyticum]|uniref:hypothetical protein n=1 Tax=Chromobacterium haemolyticum TaxID=394935 RepID=UPI002448EC89|nr:hypothetical protein [Chromobacterium haemolyticum]MDH0342114.1 hypothetical protein [Chromobacterium haemolyticum]
MARIKYFCDLDGDVVELTAVTCMDNKEFASRFPGIAGFRYDGYNKWVGIAAGSDELLPVTRKIEYKTRPSLHECNAKCLNGKCNGVCECRCGGKNHGRGAFINTYKAA